MAFNADSTLAFAGTCMTLTGDTCTDGELIVWDIATGTELRRLEGHTDWVTSLAFHPTRPSYALSASNDGTLILWNVETGELIRRFEGHTGSTNSVAFSADGATALSGSDDRTVILWDVATGQIIRRFEGHADSVTTVAFSPDGQLVAAGGNTEDPTAILWQIGTGDVAHKLAGPTARILSIGFRTDELGQILVFAFSYDSIYREWNVDTGDLIRTEQVSNAATGMTLSPDGRISLTNNGSGGELVDVGTWARLAMNLVPSMQLVLASSISPDGKLALFGSDAGEVILVNLPVSNEIRRFHIEGGLSTVDISPDGRYLLTGSNSSGTAILWDVQTGQEIRHLEGLEPVISSAAFSLDGHQALIGSADLWAGTRAGKVVLWDVETGDRLHEWTDFEYYPRSVAISPDGRTALVGTIQWGAAWTDMGGGELILLDLATGQMIRRLENTTNVLDISFSPDGHLAVTANSVEDVVTLWDVDTGKRIRQFDYFSCAVLFTTDSRYFLTGSLGGFIYLVDAETGANIRVFTGSARNFWAIDVNQPQQYLLGGGEQGQLFLWNLETGEEIQHFRA